MKLKDGFVLKKIAGECVVISTNSEVDFNKLLTLNSTAESLWLAMNAGVDTVDGLVDALLAEYDVDQDRARAAVEHFIAQLKEIDLLA